MTKRQTIIDTFYFKNGACCAGCDWWQHHNSLVGDCTKSEPVSSEQRFSMLQINSQTILVGAGHIVTKRAHVCGAFKDSFKWETLPLWYLREIGFSPTPQPQGMNDAKPCNNNADI